MRNKGFGTRRYQGCFFHWRWQIDGWRRYCLRGSGSNRFFDGFLNGYRFLYRCGFWFFWLNLCRLWLFNNIVPSKCLGNPVVIVIVDICPLGLLV